MNQHKDKERLRHQRQNRLLDDVMTLVPRPLNVSASKIRKLRHLVLYYNFMQKMHAQISKDHSSFIEDTKETEKEQLVKSPNRPVEVVCQTKKKTPRANIVFLQVDRSKNEKILDEPVLKSNGYSPGSSISKNLEYEVPEVVVVNNKEDNIAVIDNNLSVGSSVHSHFNNSSSPGEISSQPDVVSKDICNEVKEEHSSTKANFIDLSSANRIQELSANPKTKISESIPIRSESLVFNKRRKTDFQNILQDYSDNSTLRDVTLPNTSINENFYVTNFNFPDRESDYFLEAAPVENIPTYPVSQYPVENVLGSNNVNYKPLCNFDSPIMESQLHHLPDYLSDNGSSSTLTDNLHIDVENSSNSSNEYMVRAGTSNDLWANNSVCGSPKALVYNYPYDAFMNYDELVLPFVSPSHGYLQNYNGQNEILFQPVGYLPHFDSIAPNNVTFGGNPSLIPCVDPIHSYRSQFVEPRFMSDNVSFYSPSAFETFPSERSLINSTPEIKCEPDSQESFSMHNNPGLFEEEVSYPLSQYISNHQ